MHNMDTKEGMWCRLIEKAFADSERTNAENAWEDLTKFIDNNQYGYFHGEEPLGQKNNVDVTDVTASHAASELAAILHAEMTSTSKKWMNLRYRNEELNNNPDAVEWLQDSINRWYNIMNDSNFATEMVKAYGQFVVLGNSAMFIDKDFDDDGGFVGLRFSALHIGQLAWEENAKGMVDRVYRKFKMTNRQILEKWPDAPMDTQDRMNMELTPFKMQEVLAAYYPNDKDKVKINDLGLASKEERPFRSIHILKNNMVVLEEDGHYEHPVKVMRWSTSPSEKYGRGRGHVGLPLIKSLNKLQENVMEATDMMIKPPLLAEQKSIVGNLSLRPGTLSITRRNPREAIVPFLTGSVSGVTGRNLELPELRQMVKEIFFIDKLLLPPRTETGEMSAFEVAQRIDQIQRVMGAVINRIEIEMLSPITVDTFSILARHNMFQEVPADLQDEIDSELEIEYVNPLARSQKIADVTNIQSWMGDLVALAQAFGPEALDYLDVDGIAKHTAKVRGVPEIAIRNDEEVQAQRQARAQQQEQDVSLDRQVKSADVAAKLARSDNQG